MLFWFIAGILTLGVVLSIIWPILKEKTLSEDPASFNLQVYADQLDELERDLMQGRIGKNDKESARLEIQRRILSTSIDIKDKDKQTHKAPSQFSRMMLVVLLAFLIPSFALGTYVSMGKPGLPSQPFNDRVAQTTPKQPTTEVPESQHAEINDMITNLQAKLDKNPNDIKSWELLGKTYLMQKKYSEAASTLERALQITPNNIGMRAAFGEALTLAANGRVTQKSESEFKAVERHTPEDPRAQYYLGLAQYQRNNLMEALRRWIALEIDTPADAPWRKMLERRIQKAETESGIDISALRLGEVTKRPIQNKTVPQNKGRSTPVSKPIPGPSQRQIAAAQNMTAKDRQSMIQSMVQRLADKLKDDPNDVDGWLRLARSYSVLKQSKKAVNAYSQAAKIAPNRIDIQLNFARALFPAGTPETEIPSRLKPVIENILKLEPNHPEAIFYRGMIAKAEGDFLLADELWTRLLKIMGPNAPARKSIETQINSLKTRK